MDKIRSVAPQKTKAVLQVQDLQVYYGESHALQGVSLTLERGVLSVVGRNGMGKTTLCNLIARFYDPTSGTVRLDGIDLGNRFCILPMEGWDGTTAGEPSDLTRRRWRNFGLSGAISSKSSTPCRRISATSSSSMISTSLCASRLM